ncbi:AGAP005890-PA-like protein [Anopheles sinensis]|uniref:AGAP005890-PA-like protein n=1 Tax=Anopheles sinensis TaxID=74873 RepID=A0A084W2R0_ANOSI|nr:AGAP005890-PA-like protein [Anopheles sinensis]
MMKFVLIGAALVAAVCAAPADNKSGQQANSGGRTDGLDQAESAWNNPNAWNAQSAWNRDPATWNHPNTWNHQAAWNHPSAWNRGYNNRNDMTTARPGYDPANRWAAGTDPWNRWGAAGAGAGWNSWAGRGAAAGWPAGAATASRWNAW